jgi:hypothetical protein
MPGPTGPFLSFPYYHVAIFPAAFATQIAGRAYFFLDVMPPVPPIYFIQSAISDSLSQIAN